MLVSACACTQLARTFMPSGPCFSLHVSRLSRCFSNFISGTPYPQALDTCSEQSHPRMLREAETVGDDPRQNRQMREAVRAVSCAASARGGALASVPQPPAAGVCASAPCCCRLCLSALPLASVPQRPAANRRTRLIHVRDDHAASGGTKARVLRGGSAGWCAGPKRLAKPGVKAGAAQLVHFRSAPDAQDAGGPFKVAKHDDEPTILLHPAWCGGAWRGVCVHSLGQRALTRCMKRPRWLVCACPMPGCHLDVRERLVAAARHVQHADSVVVHDGKRGRRVACAGARGAQVWRVRMRLLPTRATRHPLRARMRCSSHPWG